MDRTIWTLVVLNTIGGIGHHVDHTFRHNVGWPLNSHVNGYTITMLIYVVILIGAVLSRRGVVGPGFWAILCGGGLIYTALVHFVPGSPDPPGAYASQYGSTIKGTLAIVWLVLLLISLAVTLVYCTRKWAALRQSSPAQDIAT
jgi:hypothetical protein